MKNLARFIIIIHFFLATHLASGRMIFVPDEYSTIQSAIDAADAGDEVVVRDGIYEGEGFRDIRFMGKAITVRSENGNENCIIQGSGMYDDYHGFIFDHSETASSCLRGFTIKKFMSLHSPGGRAVQISDSCPTVRDCHFTGNQANGGAAIAILNSPEPVSIFDCRFSDNTSFISGGAVYAEFGLIEVAGCFFENNTGCSDGGAIGLREVTGVIVNCEFFSNVCDSNVCRMDCYGGAVGGWHNSIKIVNCLMVDNVARGNPDWPYADEAYGGAVFLDNYYQTEPNSIINCTIYGNRIERLGDGGGIYSVHDITLRSNLLWSNLNWNNRANNFVGANADIRYCTIQGGFPGEGNNGDYPRFNMPEINYFYLLPSSSAIDSGHSAASDVCFAGSEGDICLDELTTSSDGSPDTGIVDRGYHYNDPCPVDPTVTPTPTLTPKPCEDLGVKIRMPATVFRPGDSCWCWVDVCNDRAESLAGHPLFVFLDVYGDLYFAPSFCEFDHYLETFPLFVSGTTRVEVVPEFFWPCNAGTASGIHWYAALTDPGITRIIGAWDMFTFGWTDVSLPTATPRPPTFTPTITPTQPPTPTGSILIPSGTFIRGSSVSEPCRDYTHENAHTVILTRSFFMQETEVTRKMWADLRTVQPDLLADPSDTRISPTMNHPVQKVTWNEAVLYANLMSLRYGLHRCYFKDSSFSEPVDAVNYTTGSFYCDFDANGFRLPTEAEWEYACRAGTTTAFSCNEPNYASTTCRSCVAGELPILEQHAVFCANAPSGMAFVGSRAPNSWNLYDMHGNGREWCWDLCEEYYPSGPVTDPTGASSGFYHIVRGGAFDLQPVYCRSAQRANILPENRIANVSFRLVRSIE